MGMAVIISGPAECGKSKLIQAVRRRHPELGKRTRTIPMYNSRLPYADEKEGELWFFRQKHEIEKLASEEKVVAVTMRQGNMTGVDPQMIAEAAMEKDAIVIVRVASAIGAQLAGHTALKDTELRTVFLSPISMETINSLKAGGAVTHEHLKQDIIDFLRSRMRTDLYFARRLHDDLAVSMGKGAGDAYDELGNAPYFSNILVNPEILGGNQWLVDVMPEASARVFRSFVAVLRGEKPEHSESWPQDLLEGKLSTDLSSREEQIRSNFRPRRFYIREEE